MSQPSNSQIQGHVLKRFNILKKLGSGAYGHVWKVEQKSTKKVLALKKIFDAFQHATDAQRTYRQVEILKQLQHPNIIKLTSTIRAYNNKDVYLLFEYMEADLHNVVAEGILKDIHIRFIVYQVAKALKYLHSANVIHRDLKPSNILVNSNCLVKLCDFGLVRSLKKVSLGAVLTEGVATRWYRSPEVLLGSKTYSTPADIWSFGCIIFQILTGKPLFTGSCTRDQLEKICSFTGYPSEEDISSLESEMARSLIKEVKVPVNSRPMNYLKDLSEPFIDLLTRMMTFNPKKRLSVDDILTHEVTKTFHKPQEQTICLKQITPFLDDNKKVSVDEYRKLIYGISSVQPKPKVLSSSLGAGSVSPKYQIPTASSSANKSTVTYVDNRQQLVKKYSYEKNNKPGSHHVATEESQQQKPFVKYVRSVTYVSKEQPSAQKKEVIMNAEETSLGQKAPGYPSNMGITHQQLQPSSKAAQYHPKTMTQPHPQFSSPQTPPAQSYHQAQQQVHPFSQNHQHCSPQVKASQFPPQNNQLRHQPFPQPDSHQGLSSKQMTRPSHFMHQHNPSHPTHYEVKSGMQFKGGQKYPGLVKQSFYETRPVTAGSFHEMAPKPPA